MKEESTIIDALTDRVKELAVVYAELFKMKAIDRASEILSTIFHDIIFLTVILMVLIFTNIALAFWIGEVTGKLYLGFLLVGGFYLVVGLILRVFLKEWFKKKAGNYFIKNIFRDTEL
jgi:hypothetical protein